MLPLIWSSKSDSNSQSFYFLEGWVTLKEDNLEFKYFLKKKLVMLFLGAKQNYVADAICHLKYLLLKRFILATNKHFILALYSDKL